MASQKDIKSRISSVKNIRKITRAMEMVAAARLRRAEQRIEQLRPYADAIRRMTRRATEAAENIPNLPILLEREEIRTVGTLLVAVRAERVDVAVHPVVAQRHAGHVSRPGWRSGRRTRRRAR